MNRVLISTGLLALLFVAFAIGRATAPQHPYPRPRGIVMQVETLKGSAELTLDIYNGDVLRVSASPSGDIIVSCPDGGAYVGDTTVKW
jgi:hypothetical protein